MFNKQITVSESAARQYGLSSAVLLQQLHNQDAARDWVKEVSLFALCTWWDESTVKRLVTKLETSGELTTSKQDGNRLVRLGGVKSTNDKQKTEQIALFSVKTPKKKKKSQTPLQTMNQALRTVMNTPKTVAYTRHLRFAKKILADGYTTVQVETWYGEGGWWYKNYWKGENGWTPQQRDIEDTLEMASDNKQKQTTGSTKGASLWDN